jgi:hypothetical protein
MATKIRNIVAPNLPTAPVEYQQRYQDQLNNQLRIYFNQVDGNTQELIQKLNSLSVMTWLGEGSF